MIKTEFFEDFIEYYRKAEMLQRRALQQLPPTFKVGEPIMDNVSIYDTVNRRHAGFSKVLEDIHGVRTRKDLIRLPDYSKRLDMAQFHFLHLVHRFTGSGASFQPTLLQDGTRNPKEHGYHNSIVGRLSEIMANETLAEVKQAIVTNTKPMVTSVGNQPPSLKNPYPEKYRLAQQYYFDQIAEHYIKDYVEYVRSRSERVGKPIGIKEAVDFSCEWHKSRGFKQWHFVLTAFVMDTAEYYPELVDPASHCYYGSNCSKTFDLIFIKEKSDSKNKAQFQEECMAELCKAVGGRPYDVEDVCCDYIRYIKEHVPKGYEHLSKAQTVNSSLTKIDGEYPEQIQERITKILG